MKSAFPELAKGLQTLLDYEGADVEDVFSLSFEVEYDYFGELRTHPLLPNGSKVTHRKPRRGHTLLQLVFL